MNQRYEKSCQYVGIDLHRRRSVVLRMDGEGEVVECVRIDNSVPALVAEVSKAGLGAPVAIEATYGWYWAVDALTEAGFAVVLAHPRGIKSMRNRRAKTDQLDAEGAGGLAAPGAAREGVDRPTGGPGAAGAGPLPAQARARPGGGEGEHPRGAGQVRGDPRDRGRLRPGRDDDARRPGAAGAVRLEGRLAASHPHRVEPRDRRGRGRDRAPAAGQPAVPGPAVDRRGRSGDGGDLRRGDRRRAPRSPVRTSSPVRLG